MNCQNCGKSNPDGARFCTGCGAKLEAAPVRCPKCGMVKESGSKFCVNCGTQFGAPPRPANRAGSHSAAESAYKRSSRQYERRSNPKLFVSGAIGAAAAIMSIIFTIVFLTSQYGIRFIIQCFQFIGYIGQYGGAASYLGSGASSAIAGATVFLIILAVLSIFIGLLLLAGVACNGLFTLKSFMRASGNADKVSGIPGNTKGLIVLNCGIILAPILVMIAFGIAMGIISSYMGSSYGGFFAPGIYIGIIITGVIGAAAGIVSLVLNKRR